MSDHEHHHHHTESLNRTALMATVHCLSGCAIGEVAGMVIGTGLGLSNGGDRRAFGDPGLHHRLWPDHTAAAEERHGVAGGGGLALASDTLSVATMEVVDNALMLVIPGAMSATLAEPLFWASLAGSLVIAGAAAFPVNRWLIARGKGHALVHHHH